MSGNPFRTPEADLSPSTIAPSMIWQPYAFAAVPLVVALSLVAVSVYLGWISAGVPWDQVFFDSRYFLTVVVKRVIDILPTCALVLLYVHQQCSRHSIIRFRPATVLLPVFALLYGLAMSSAQLLSAWASMSLGLGIGVLSKELLLPLLGGLVPLWLVLRLARSRAERCESGDASVAGRQLVLMVALCTGALIIKALVYVFTLQVAFYDGGSQLLMGILCSAVVLASGWSYLPARSSRFSVGRVLAAAIVIACLWGGFLALTGWGAWQLLSDVENNYISNIVLPLAALGLLALLWPITRLGLRCALPMS